MPTSVPDQTGTPANPLLTLARRAFGRPSGQVNNAPGEVVDRVSVGNPWGPTDFEVPGSSDRRVKLIALVVLVVAVVVVTGLGWFFYDKLTQS